MSVPYWSLRTQLLQCQLAVQTLCLFVEVEGAGSSRMASRALPLLSSYLSPSHQMEEEEEEEEDEGEKEEEEEETQNGVEVTEDGEEVEGAESSAAMETDAAEGIVRRPFVEPPLGAGTEPPVARDHLLFTTLTCLGKMLSTCSALIRDETLQVSLNEVWGKLMLLYEIWLLLTHKTSHITLLSQLQSERKHSYYIRMLGFVCPPHDSPVFSLLPTSLRSWPLERAREESTS